MASHSGRVFPAEAPRAFAGVKAPSVEPPSAARAPETASARTDAPAAAHLPSFDFRKIPLRRPGSWVAAQAKLEVGATDDPLEHEADRVAERVVRGPEGETAQVRPAGSALQRRGEEDDEAVRRSPQPAATASAASAPPIVDSVLGSTGEPLDGGARAFLEPRFGADFGAVRVHTGSIADASARAVGAKAYTVGSHIVFRHGAYDTRTESGHLLLAHELAHVVQQRGGGEARLRRKADQPLSWNGMHGPAVLEAKKGLNRYQEQERAAGRAGFGADWKALTENDRVDNATSAALGAFQRQRRLKHRDSRLWQETLDALGHTSPAAPAQAPAAQPGASDTSGMLPPTQDAISGVHLDFMAGPLPRAEGTLDRFNFKNGPYKFAPNLRDRSGTPKVVYYIAYRTDAKRNEYVIGPDSLQLFTAHLDTFRSIGDTAYADPDVIDYIIGFGDAVWDQQGDIVTQYMRWLGLHDFEEIHAEMVREGKRIRDEQRTKQQRDAKATIAAKVLPLVNAAMAAAAGARLLAGGRVPPASGGAPPGPGIETPAPGVETPAPGAKAPPTGTETPPTQARPPAPRPAAGSPAQPATAAQETTLGSPRGAPQEVVVAPVMIKAAGPGVAYGEQAAARLAAQGKIGPRILRPLTQELNASNLSPADRATAMQVACNRQGATFGAGPIARMANGNLVVTSREAFNKAPVIVVKPDGTVLRAAADLAYIRDSNGLVTAYSVSNVVIEQ
jgi:hypothetical protein